MCPFLSVCSTSAWGRGWFWSWKFWLKDELPKLIFSYYRLWNLSLSWEWVKSEYYSVSCYLISSLGTVTNRDRFFLCWDLRPLPELCFVRGMTSCHCEWTCHGVLVWWCDDSPTGAKGIPAYQDYGLLLVPTPCHWLPFPVFTHRHTCWVPRSVSDSNRAFTNE